MAVVKPQTDEEYQAEVRARALYLVQEAADAYWNEKRPGEVASHQFRMGFYAGRFPLEEALKQIAEPIEGWKAQQIAQRALSKATAV